MTLLSSQKSRLILISNQCIIIKMKNWSLLYIFVQGASYKMSLDINSINYPKSYSESLLGSYGIFPCSCLSPPWKRSSIYAKMRFYFLIIAEKENNTPPPPPSTPPPPHFRLIFENKTQQIQVQSALVHCICFSHKNFLLLHFFFPLFGQTTQQFLRLLSYTSDTQCMFPSWASDVCLKSSPAGWIQRSTIISTVANDRSSWN